MPEQITLGHVERKAAVINRDYGTDLSIERFNGAYRACMHGGSKNLTPLLTKRLLWTALDAFEEGLFWGRRQCEEKIRFLSQQFKPKFLSICQSCVFKHPNFFDMLTTYSIRQAKCDICGRTNDLATVRTKGE